MFMKKQSLLVIAVCSVIIFYVVYYPDTQIANQSVAKCRYIADREYRNACYKKIAYINQNLTLCNNTDEEISRYECYRGVAIAQKN